MFKKGNSNVLDPSTFDEIYIKGIQAGEHMATTPDQRHHYFKGFNQAIILLDQYFIEEKISYSEVKFRLNAIMELMVAEPKQFNKTLSFGRNKKNDKKAKTVKTVKIAKPRAKPERLPDGRFKRKVDYAKQQPED